jgi:dephospho-CoA kinase
MLAVGLTGGIGAGKSTVAELFVGHGAKLVDADLIAREVVAPGGPAYQPLIDRFGPDLNAITHPAIGTEMIARRDRHAGTDDIVILDIPLLRPVHRELLDLAAVVVVDTPTELALERLVTLRGMSRDDARARIESQPDRQSRLDGADLVVDNSSDQDHLRSEVDRVWQVLVAMDPGADGEATA